MPDWARMVFWGGWGILVAVGFFVVIFVSVVAAVLAAGVVLFGARLGSSVRVDSTSGDLFGGWLSTRRIMVSDVCAPGGKRLYMRRTYLLPRNDYFNAYLHEWFSSDEYDVVLHDHPWGSISCCIGGVLREHFYRADADGGRVLVCRDVPLFLPVYRSAEFVHAIEVPPGQLRPPRTLFFTGRVVRSWNFICRGSRKVIPHAEYQRGGPGCGD